MEDINYFKDMFNSIPYIKKIILLCFIFKRDDILLGECGMTNDFIEKLHNDCKQIIENDLDQYFSHFKNLEESIMENNS